jgi:hypothetical protein
VVQLAAAAPRLVDRLSKIAVVSMRSLKIFVPFSKTRRIRAVGLKVAGKLVLDYLTILFCWGLIVAVSPTGLRSRSEANDAQQLSRAIETEHHVKFVREAPIRTP